MKMPTRLNCLVITLLYVIVFTLVACMAQRSFGQAVCPEPRLEFQDNIGGDTRFVVLSWQDPPGCEFFLEGTRQTDPDPFTDPAAEWFTLQPTFYFRSLTRTNGGWRISPPTKRVLVDMEDFRDPYVKTNTVYAPQCWFERFKQF